MIPEEFLVLGQEAGGAGGEPRGVVLGDGSQGVGRDGVGPDPGQVGLVARVLLDQDIAVAVDGQVVHHLRPLCAVEQHREGSARGRVAHVIEPEAPQARVPHLRCGLEAVGGDEVEVVRVARIPGAVLRSEKLGDAVLHRRDLELVTCPGRDVAERVELERGAGAVHARKPVLHRCAGVRDPLVAAVCGGGAWDGHTEERAADEAGALERGAAALLLADVDVDLARRGVVKADHDGLPPAGGRRDQVLPARLAEGGQLMGGALRSAGHEMGERTTLVTRLLAAEEDPAVVAGPGAGVPERGLGGQVGGAEAVEVGVGAGARLIRIGGRVPEVGGADEVRPLVDLEIVAVDLPLRDEGAAGTAVRPSDADAGPKLVGHEEPQLVVVGEHAKPIGDSDK